jgi:hypothetical protein
LWPRERCYGLSRSLSKRRIVSRGRAVAHLDAPNQGRLPDESRLPIVSHGAGWQYGVACTGVLSGLVATRRRGRPSGSGGPHLIRSVPEHSRAAEDQATVVAGRVPWWLVWAAMLVLVSVLGVAFALAGGDEAPAGEFVEGGGSSRGCAMPPDAASGDDWSPAAVTDLFRVRPFCCASRHGGPCLDRDGRPAQSDLEAVPIRGPPEVRPFFASPAAARRAAPASPHPSSYSSPFLTGSQLTISLRLITRTARPPSASVEPGPRARRRLQCCR